MLLTLLGGLLLMTDDPTAPTYDRDLMGVSMVVINSFGFLALAGSLILMHPKVRARCNRGGAGQVEVGDKTKVTPSEGSRPGTDLRNWE